MRKILFAAMMSLIPMMALGQSDETERDKNFLVKLLEDNLSGDDRVVRIEGFRGALSRRASLDELTIADADGVWLTLSNAVLDWDRLALLSGKLIVNELTATEIVLDGPPAPSKTAPSAAARGFALPELPVSVQIGTFSIDTAILGEAILGEPAEVSVSGVAQLNDGAGSGSISIVRTDGPAARVEFVGGYENQSQRLAIDLLVAEEKDGLLAKAIGLPDAPSLRFSIKGDAPLGDFAADISLETNEQTHLAGQITIQETTPSENPSDMAGHAFGAQISGDVTPLFASEYHSFFGTDTRLAASGTRFQDGRLILDQLSLETKTFHLNGALDLAKDGLPNSFSLTADIDPQAGAPVRLPFGKGQTFVRSATITAAFDAADGDKWDAQFALLGYEGASAKIESIHLDANGNIARSAGRDGIGAKSVSARLDFGLNGFAPANAGLGTAVGADLQGVTELFWENGERLTISQLDLTSDGLKLAIAGKIDGLSSGMELDGNARVVAADISRFSELAGVALGGAADFELTGQGSILSGAFDLQLSGSGQDLISGVDAVDELIAGNAKLDLAVERNTGGTRLKDFDLETKALSIQANGDLNDTSSALQLAARLDNLGRLVDGLSGELTLDGTARQNHSNWDIESSLLGPGGTRARVSGGLDRADDTVNLTTNGQIPLALINKFTRHVSVHGLAQFELAIVGPAVLSSVSGVLETSKSRLIVPAAAATFNDLNIRAGIRSGRTNIDASANIAKGGRVSTKGDLSLSAPYPANLNVNLDRIVLSDPLLYETLISGDLNFAGPLLGNGNISGDIKLGATEIQVSTGSSVDSEILTGMTHLGEPAAAHQTRQRAGLLAEQNAETSSNSPVFGLDVSIVAANQVFIRGNGLDAELRGDIRLTGTTENIVPIGDLDLVRGRFDILSKRLDLEEGIMVMQGSFDPYVRLVASSDSDGVTARIILEGLVDDLDISFTSDPELPEEEVLSRLLFGHSINEISPFQAAQLAAAAGGITGGSGRLVNDVRDRFGLDNLDILADETGRASLQFGKYFTENLYSDITVDSTGKSAINLNLEISDAVTAKGTADSDGETGIGVFFEKDY